MNMEEFKGCSLVIITAVVCFVIALLAIPPRVKEPAAHTVPYKSEQCTKHNVTDVNGKDHLLLMCPSGNYLLDPVVGEP